jgi:hypothetical protein
MRAGNSSLISRSQLADDLQALRLEQRRPAVSNIGPTTTARRERRSADSRDPAGAAQSPAALCSPPRARRCAHLVAAHRACLAACLTDLPLASAFRWLYRTRATSLRFELNIPTPVSAPPPAQVLARAGSLDCQPLGAYAGVLLAGRDRAAERERARRGPAAARGSAAVSWRTLCGLRRRAAAMRVTRARSCALVRVQGMCEACETYRLQRMTFSVALLS